MEYSLILKRTRKTTATNLANKRVSQECQIKINVIHNSIKVNKRQNDTMLKVSIITFRAKREVEIAKIVRRYLKALTILSLMLKVIILVFILGN